MATSYTTSLRLSEPTPGDPLVKNQWGTILNTNMVLIDSAITGVAAVNIGGLTTYSLTVGNGTADQARCQFYSFSGALTGDCTVTMPTVPKVVWAANLTTGGNNVVLTTGGGTTVTLPNDSTWALIRCDGTNVTNMAVHFSSIVSTGGVQSQNGDSGGLNFRATTGSTSIGIRNDGTNGYLLDAASATGSFSSHRPFYWNLSTAAVNIDGTGAGTTFGGSVTAKGFSCRGGSTGPIRVNLQNIDWNGSVAGLWIDTTFLGNFAYTSDRRVKQGIVDAPNGALDRVMQWRVVNFDYADIGIFKASGRSNLGFVADELQAVTPQAVTGAPDAKTPDGNIQPQTLNPIPMIAELTAAIQELRREVAALKGG